MHAKICYYIETVSHLNLCIDLVIIRSDIFIIFCVNTVKGEGGAPVYTSMEERGRADRLMREYGFNMVVSDKIAMNRTIPDTRMPE